MNSVRTHLTSGDFARFNTWAFLRKGSTRAKFVAYLVLACAAIPFVSGVPRSQPDVLKLLLVAAVVAAILTSLHFAVALWFGVARAKSAGGVLGEHEYTFQDGGLLERTSAGETLIKWGEAARVRRTADSLHIEVAPGRFHDLPRRAFETESDYESFWQSAQRLETTGARQGVGAVAMILAWVLWLAVTGTSTYFGLILLAFGLQQPDHPVAADVARLRTTVILGGLAVPFVASLGFMIASRFGFGLLLALLMFPFMLVIAFMFGA